MASLQIVRVHARRSFADARLCPSQNLFLLSSGEKHRFMIFFESVFRVVLKFVSLGFEDFCSCVAVLADGSERVSRGVGCDWGSRLGKLRQVTMCGGPI